MSVGVHAGLHDYVHSIIEASSFKTTLKVVPLRKESNFWTSECSKTTKRKGWWWVWRFKRAS